MPHLQHLIQPQLCLLTDGRDWAQASTFLVEANRPWKTADEVYAMNCLNDHGALLNAEIKNWNELGFFFLNKFYYLVGGHLLVAGKGGYQHRIK